MMCIVCVSARHVLCSKCSVECCCLGETFCVMCVCLRSVCAGVLCACVMCLRLGYVCKGLCVFACEMYVCPLRGGNRVVSGYNCVVS